jgi:hypothetical protein
VTAFWRNVMLVFAVSAFCRVAAAQESEKNKQREFPFPISSVEAALRQLGAYTGARLPTVEGFIRTDRAQLPKYQRAYYEYKIELVPEAADRTLVRIKANVSAWYQDPQGTQSGYQAFESNGRLESDLFDRLNDFLNSKPQLDAEPKSLATKLGDIRRQRAQTEARIGELQDKLQKLQDTASTENPTDYACVLKSPTLILARPAEPSTVLLRARSEDAFQILETRGAWLRVGLENSRSGWIKRAQVQVNSSGLREPAGVQTSHSLSPNFTVIREAASTFSGDWPRLKHRQALYIWARPVGLAPNLAIGEKWDFAATIFKERYRELSHTSDNPPDGIVLIFLDDRGGVAAAVLDDIRQWAEGSLSSSAFLKRCSLDPPGAFDVPGRTSKASAP